MLGSMHELSQRLLVRWDRTEKSVPNVFGIPRSKRSGPDPVKASGLPTEMKSEVSELEVLLKTGCLHPPLNFLPDRASFIK